MIKKGLGKGLGALIANDENEESGIIELRINDIEPNENQPRKEFDDEKLLQLAESIKQHGVVQPIIVKKEDGIYRIVAGERRWRASRIAGQATIPAIIKELSDKQLMEVALIENLQREDLNPVEEAEAYIKLTKEYNMTQEEISKSVGKSRSAIANSMRLLNLTSDVLKYLSTGELTSGHARCLIAINDPKEQLDAAKSIIEKQLNVRDAEKLVKKILTRKPTQKQKKENEDLSEIEDKFKNVFGTKVKLITGNKKGKILIEYYSNEDLDRIIEIVDNIGKYSTS